jgi:hypothetical protein
MSEDDAKDCEPTVERRGMLKGAMLGGIVGVALLPESWVRPVIESVTVPAHAATSPTAGPTTTIAPTTSPFGSTTAPFVTTTAVFGTTTAVFGTTTAVFGTTTAVFGTTTAVFGTTTAVFSDIRLKRDIEFIGRLENRLRLYRYRYLWSDTEYVGVMAQEVAAVVPDAVVRGRNGYLHVDYGRLGLNFMTWEEWLASPGERFRKMH